MKCPKCDEGNLKKVIFKKNNNSGHICEFCGTIWNENEPINETSGHVFESQIPSDKEEYSFDDFEFDQESENVTYSKYK